MFIYKGYTDNLFVSKNLLSETDLYDPDYGTGFLLGEANTRTEAWNLLKKHTSTFDESLCEKCPYEIYSDNCEKTCEQYNNNYDGFDYAYVSKFLYENFKSEGKDAFLVLIGKHIDCDNMLFVNCFPSEYKGTNIVKLPITPTIEKDIHIPIFSLTYYFDNYKEKSLKYIGKKYINKKLYIFYSCESEEPGDEWKDSCHCVRNGWYGYLDIEDVKNRVFEKDVLNEYFKLIQKY